MRNLLLFFLALFPTSFYAQERYLDSIFEVAEVNTKLYAEKDGEELTLDIYQPKDDSESKRPLLVFMHGGGFSGGSQASARMQNSIDSSQEHLGFRTVATPDMLK